MKEVDIYKKLAGYKTETTCEIVVCGNCDGTGCILCGHTGEIDEDDPYYDELGAEANREERN